MHKTSIIILTCNNLHYSQLCIQSIRTYSTAGKYEIIVVDNHSTDGTVEWLKTQKDLKTVINTQNEGFPKGCNQGIAIAEKDNDILLLNNDTIVTARWLENLKTCLYSDTQVGATGPVTNFCSNYQAIETDFKDMADMQQFAQRFNAAPVPDYECREKLIGFCMLIKREALDRVGLLDERFTPGNYEDDDYSYRLQEAGYKLILCNSTFVYHFGSKSFKKDRKAYAERLSINAKKFEEKWGFNPNYSSYIRHEIIRLIDRKKEDPICVLEVGCACGATLLKIQHYYKNARLYGIELNHAAAKIASCYASVVNENIEKSSSYFEPGSFDYIIFADVLEHLYDPGAVLANMRKYLKDGGCILASIPNIMHYSVMAGLFNGNFTYGDAGILDRSHVRFFTLFEIHRLFTAAGYQNMQYANTVSNGSKNDSVKDFVDKLVAISGEEKRQQFMTYQYIVKAQNVVSSPKEEKKVSSDLSLTESMSNFEKKLVFLLRRLENEVEPNTNFSELRALLERHDVSIEQIEKLVKSHAADPAKQFNILGMIYNDMGNKQRAMECFLDAYEKDHQNMDVIYNTVSLLLEFNEKEYAKVILDKCDPQDVVIQELLSKL